MANRHLQLIPTKDIYAVRDLLIQARSLLAAYVTPLTPAERRAMIKMGAKTLSFVEKAHEFAHANPILCPPYLDMAGFDIDFADASGLWDVIVSSQQLHELLDDTGMLAGSEAYQAALVFYNSVKVAARQNVPGAKAVYEELKKRFPTGKRKTDETESETVV
ncbi:MAG: hypothetical protein LBS80_03820 [Tannerella sp.]|jgi:hypothetical protein|nr:hypothetical protein [Tannerella sp.]